MFLIYVLLYCCWEDRAYKKIGWRIGNQIFFVSFSMENTLMKVSVIWEQILRLRKKISHQSSFLMKLTLFTFSCWCKYVIVSLGRGLEYPRSNCNSGQQHSSCVYNFPQCCLKNLVDSCVCIFWKPTRFNGLTRFLWQHLGNRYTRTRRLCHPVACTYIELNICAKPTK